MDSSAQWSVIQHLRSTRGTKAKQVLLENTPELRRNLVWAYNPYEQFGITPANTWYGFGTENFSNNTYIMLADLASGKLSGSAAKREVQKHIQSLNYDSGELLKCILNKSFDIGLAEKSINAVFPNLIPTHAIQLAKPVDWKHVKFPCYTSPKLDGLRAIFRDGVFYSRKGHRLQGLSSLARRCAEAFGGISLDGELMVPGVHFNEISGKIRSFNETPNAVYHVFDLPDHTGTLEARLQTMWRWSATWQKIKFPRISLVTHTECESRDDAEEWYLHHRRNGYEGSVLKNADALYENSRSWAWQKMKATETADCKVIGIYGGQGKYTGLCGGLYVDYKGVKVGVGSGLTDRQRAIWADAPEEIMGRTIEVAYQEVTPDGSLRHPRLVCIRGDL